MDQRCTECGLVKHLDEFIPRTDPETDFIVGYMATCKKCDYGRWLAKRDGMDLSKVKYDKFGNEVGPRNVGSAHIKLFTEAVREEAIKQIQRDRSLQLCADTIGVTLPTLLSWLDKEREPYASWARRFRIARAQSHKKPFLDAMEQEARAGNVRAIEFLLKTGWRDEFDPSKEVDMTVRRGKDEIDTSKYSTEELQQLRTLLSRGEDTE